MNHGKRSLPALFGSQIACQDSPISVEIIKPLFGIENERQSKEIPDLGQSGKPLLMATKHPSTGLKGKTSLLHYRIS